MSTTDQTPTEENREPATDDTERAVSLRPHSIFKEASQPVTLHPDGVECEHGRPWCPGPDGLRWGVLPCWDCYQDADDEQKVAWRDVPEDDQVTATPRIGGDRP